MFSLEFFGKGDDAKVFGVIGGIMAPVIWAFMPGWGWALIFGCAGIMTLGDLLMLGQPKTKSKSD